MKQPIIIGYVLSGFFFALFMVRGGFDGEEIIILSELGITFLLFLMGLEFDLKSLKYLGKDILISSGIQSLIFFFSAFGLALLFKFTTMESIYLGILFMFGSTLLVAKWLEDKKETTALHGKIILGTLIIQDVFAIITLTVMGVMQEKSVIKIVLAPVGGIILVLIAFFLAKYLLNYLIRIASKYPELLFIFSLGVCFFFVEISPILGYSTTIGAFIAGITLANTIYKNEVSTRLKPLINFFNMLFFVGLGFQMKTEIGLNHILFMLVLVVLCMILKPIVTYYTLRMRGYDTKTSFMGGLYLAQLSEFGIIIIGAGVLTKTIPPVISAIAIISVILTMILSSYAIKYDKRIYKYFEGHLRVLDKKLINKDIKTESKSVDCNILIFGYYELGKELCTKLKSLGKKIMVVENDPENIEMLKGDGIEYLYNSASNPEFFENTTFQNLEIVISNIIDLETNKLIIKELKIDNPKLIVITTAKSLKESMELYNHNADYVIYQSYLNEQQVSVLLEDYATDVHKVITKKIHDITKFKEKEEKMKKIHEEENRFWDIDVFLHRLGSKNHHGHSKDNKDKHKINEKEEGKTDEKERAAKPLEVKLEPVKLNPEHAQNPEHPVTVINKTI